MERRTLLGAIGTGGLGVGAIVLAWQLDQGNISLPGEEADLSGTVRRDSETFEIDAEAGQDLRISVTDLGDAPYRGAFRLYAPDGTEVAEDGPGSIERVTVTHTAEQTGTYEFEVVASRTELRYSVLIQDGE